MLKGLHWGLKFSLPMGNSYQEACIISIICQMISGINAAFITSNDKEIITFQFLNFRYLRCVDTTRKNEIHLVMDIDILLQPKSHFRQKSCLLQFLGGKTLMLLDTENIGFLSYWQFKIVRKRLKVVSKILTCGVFYSHCKKQGNANSNRI